MGMQGTGWWVDDEAHMLHRGSRAFACDRDIVRLCIWQGHALLLSADTDCLSLWDDEGLVRTARVGVYPQDMAVLDDMALVCGGADCQLHSLSLPSLHSRCDATLPGMPERIALHHDMAHVLTLLTEPDLRTQLLTVHPLDGTYHPRLTLPGIPGAIAADEGGLWIGVSGQVIHLPEDAFTPDVTIEGIELPEHIKVFPGGVTITDGLTGRAFRLVRANEKERSPCDERS